MRAYIAGDCIVVDSERIVPLGYFKRVAVAGREIHAVAFDTDEGWATGWFGDDPEQCVTCRRRKDVTFRGKVEVEVNEEVTVGN